MVFPHVLLAADAGTHPAEYSPPAWSPYVVGALIGVLSMSTFYFSKKPIGASTAFARVAGMIGLAIAPEHTKSLDYYEKNRPVIDWEVMLVLGVILGACLAAWQGGEFTGQWVPEMWSARFGEHSLAGRLIATLFGGILMAFGARLAGGCTSGHGISGTLQLSVGSWVTVICLFAGGIVAAMLMFRV